jgi:Chitobiase/beta-hexosaminidase C-terminal domain
LISNNRYAAGIYKLSISGPFSFNNPCSNPLPANYGCTMTVTFNPLSAGKFTGTLTVSVPGLTQTSSIALSGTAIPTVATPTLTPGGTYDGSKSVTISDATPGATIYYTTNDSAPTTSSAKYTGPITVASTETIEAFAVASGYANSAVASATYTVAEPLQFVPVTPCRVADTRNGTGPFGGPEMSAGQSRSFNIAQSGCGIPANASAYSLNVTVVPGKTLNYLTLWPTGEAQPYVSTLNSYDGRVKANAAIVPAGSEGGVSVYVSDATQVILDIDGYFVPAGSGSYPALAFYPLTPCRVADSRNASGALGGPSLAGGGSRAFPIQSSSCGVPSAALAYSLNVTAIPHKTLNYLTTWPTGSAQPNVSTLNSSTGAITANAAIVPAGSSGEVSIFVSDDADVILDVDGYFASPGSGGLSLYAVTPCRTIDTRSQKAPFPGTLPVSIEGSTCAPPATAEAYVLNATVVPTGSFSYLTLWPAGESQPYVSTLNAYDGAITSNMAIVPTTNGEIDTYSPGPGNLILDLSSYFAP